MIVVAGAGNGGECLRMIDCQETNKKGVQIVKSQGIAK